MQVQRSRRLSDRELIIKNVIDNYISNEFKIAELAGQLGFTTKSQKDELRRTLRKRQKVLGITLEGHTIRKI